MTSRWFGPRGDCGCCEPELCSCAGTGPDYVGFDQIKVTISGLPSSLAYSKGVYRNPSCPGTPSLGYFFADHDILGLDALNGTHFFDVPHYTPSKCIDNTADILPGQFFPYEVDGVEFSIDKAISGQFYNSSTCVPASFSTSQTDTLKFRIIVFKLSANHFRVTARGLFYSDGTSTAVCTGIGTGSAIDILPSIRACQNIGCSNEFDALTDFSELGPGGWDEGEISGTFCKDGLISFETSTDDACGQSGSGYTLTTIGSIAAEVVR